MKIIIPNFDVPIFKYIAQCLETIASDNLNVLYWNPSIVPIIDMFDELNPSVVFLHESQLDESFKIVCRDFDFKYVVFVNGETALPADLAHPPHAIIALPDSKVAFNDHPVIRIRPIANIPEIHNARYVENLKSEILIDTTHVNIDDELLKLLSYLIATHHTKIIGDNALPLHQYMGKVTMSERANFIKSTNIFLDIGTDGHYLDAAYLKVAALTTHSTSSVVLNFNNLSTLQTHLGTLINKDLVQQQYINQCYSHVCEKNASYHFSSELFNLISESDIAKTLLEYMKGITC
tara:strand:+ start:221 stop:1096 length:876 start_codon:yes stop_codon:yes gene_type:complete